MMALKVLKKELKENLKKKRVLFSAVFIIALGAFILLSNTEPVAAAAESYQGAFVLLMILAYPLFLSVMSMGFTVQDTVFVEKVTKGCENLLATPLSVKDLIIGKSLFCFMFTYPPMLVVMLIFLLDLSIKNIPYPIPYVIVGLALLLPAIVFAAGTIIVASILQYRSGQQIMMALQLAVMLSFIGFLFAAPSYIIPFIASSGLQLRLQMVFMLPFLAIAIVLAALAWIMVRFADGERIVLTG